MFRVHQHHVYRLRHLTAGAETTLEVVQRDAYETDCYNSPESSRRRHQDRERLHLDKHSGVIPDLRTDVAGQTR